MKLEYRQNPTERIQLRLEVKTQMMRRVEDQLNSLTAELASTPEVLLSDLIRSVREESLDNWLSALPILAPQSSITVHERLY